MKITSTKKVFIDTALVFVVREGVNIETHPFFGELKEEDRLNMHSLTSHTHQGEGGYEHVLLLSGGRRALLFGIENLTHRKAIRLMRRIIVLARKERVKKLIINLNDFINTTSEKETLAELLATQLEIANFEYVEYKETPKSGWFFVEEAFVYSGEDVQNALQRGKIIGEEINNARVLSNTPGGDMTPQRLAEAAVRVGRASGFKVRVLDEGTMRRLKMGGILGVSQGSSEKPQFIIMEYLKGGRNEKPVVLVGKGVTFDTGGLNLKSSDGIYEMHMDMSGGAAVIHVISALARLKVKKNIVGLVPAAENMPSGSSYRPGDVLRTMSGKTIEVLNTDAEGRILLADALHYAQQYKPELVIDVATLTGAACVALGSRATALFATDSAVSKKLEKAGEEVYDLVWPLPLWEEYEEDIKGTFGDVANTSTRKSPGSVSTSAAYLWQFIKGYNWVHLDIAPRMTTIESDNLARGASGASVALLTQFLRNFWV